MGTVNSTAVLKQRNLNSHLCQVHPTRKMSELLLHHDNTGAHGCVYHWTAGTPTQCPDFALSDFHF
jgi:hypothetical protein